MIKVCMSLPEGIRREATSDGVRYLLPRRPWGSVAGLICFVFAVLLFALGSIYLFVIPGKNLFSVPSDPRLSRGWGILPLAAGLGMLVTGLFMAFGRLEIEWTPRRFLVRSRALFLFWTRSHPAEGLRVLTAVQTPAGEGMTNPAFDDIKAMGILRATWEGGSSLHVAAAYPPSWFYAVAQDLAARAGGTISVERFGPAFFDATAVKLEQPPRGSRAQLRRNPEGIVLQLPARGIRRAARAT